MASPPRGPQHPFWRGFEGQAQPQHADELLIGRLLASAPPSGPAAPAPLREPTEAEMVVDLTEVVVPDAVEFGDPIVRFITLAPRPPRPHRLVSLPVDHRKNPRVVRLHGPHLDRNLTERDKFDHWRRWMAASKRKELA